MNILVIYEHNQNDSFCLFSAISECLAKNPTFTIILKNLDQAENTEKLAWFKSIKKRFKEKVRTYDKKEEVIISIICSLTEKTPYFFLQDQKPKRVGIFNKKKKIVTYDYTSPFLLMKNCPNKLNRENIYNLIINGSVSKSIYQEEKQGANKNASKNEEIFHSKENKIRIEKREIKNLITNENIELDTGDNKYYCKRYNKLQFYGTDKPLNLYEEIIHLSIIFSIYDIDYVIPAIETKESDLNPFQECLERSFECLDYVKLFIDQNRIERINESINLFYMSMSRFQVFEPIREFFEITSKTCPESDPALKNKQLKDLCDITRTVLRTAYHLGQQKKQKFGTQISENN